MLFVYLDQTDDKQHYTEKDQHLRKIFVPKDLAYIILH